MLPLIATHHVDMMNLSKILQILCIEVERKVISILSVPTLASIIVVVIVITAIFLVALTRLEVHTGIHVNVEVFKSMNLIVKLDISCQLLTLTLVRSFVKVMHWVVCRKRVLRESPSCITTVNNTMILEVATEVLLIEVIIHINRLCGIH